MNARQTVVTFLKAHQARDEKQIALLCANDIRVRGGPINIVGAEHYLQEERKLWQDIPSQIVVAENIVVSGDEVVVQWIDQAGTSESTKLTTAGCSVFKVINGKINEVYVYVDRSTIPAVSIS